MKNKQSSLNHCVRSGKVLALILGTVLGSVYSPVFASTWTGGAGNWTDTGNPGWNGAYPDAIGAIASFTNTQTGTAATIQNIAASVTVGTLEYSAAGANQVRTITMTNPLTFNQNGGVAGSATISNTNSNTGTNNRLSFSAGSIVLADDLLITNTGGSTSTTASIQFLAGISGTGNLTISNVSNTFDHATGAHAGAVTFGAANSFTGNVLVEKGVVAFSNAAAFGGTGNAVALGSAGNSATVLYTGNATVANNFTVAATSGTNILGGTSTSASTTTFSGTMMLNGNLSLTSSRPVGNDVRYTGIISGSGSVTTIGTGEIQFGDGTAALTNTYTGNTTLSETSSLVLADNAKLTFVIGASGVNNKISGTANQVLRLEGDFLFDLSGAASVGSWTIVDLSTLNESFTSTFSVASGFAETFLDSGVWTRTLGPSTYTFTESTGVLSAVPEPDAISMLLGGVGLLLVLRRARRD